MIPIRAQRWMCEEKRTYMDEVTADIQANVAALKAKRPMRAYKCPNCGFWHLTTRAAA